MRKKIAQLVFHLTRISSAACLVNPATACLVAIPTLTAII